MGVCACLKGSPSSRKNCVQSDFEPKGVLQDDLLGDK